MNTRKVITPIHHYSLLCKKIPQYPAQTEEIHTGSDEPQASLLTIPEEMPATSVDVNAAEEMETQAATEDIATEMP